MSNAEGKITCSIRNYKPGEELPSGEAYTMPSVEVTLMLGSTRLAVLTAIGEVLACIYLTQWGDKFKPRSTFGGYTKDKVINIMRERIGLTDEQTSDAIAQFPDDFFATVKEQMP